VPNTTASGSPHTEDLKASYRAVDTTARLKKLPPAGGGGVYPAQSHRMNVSGRHTKVAAE